MSFTNGLMLALSNWQKGWRENQEKREQLSKELLAAVKNIDGKFKQVSTACYRKRFLHKGELKYTSKESAQRIIENTIRRVYEKVQSYKSGPKRD